MGCGDMVVIGIARDNARWGDVTISCQRDSPGSVEQQAGPDKVLLSQCTWEAQVWAKFTTEGWMHQGFL